jgi:xanthine dehydrogenase accessory factor
VAADARPRRADRLAGDPATLAGVRDVLETLERWAAEGTRAATALLVGTERSAPSEPGTALAVSERGDIAGSITGGCVEPALYEEARAVLAGGEPRLVTYGIPDEQAFEVGLPCGGTVHVFVSIFERELIDELSAAIRAERPVALELAVSGPQSGSVRLVPLDGRYEPALAGDVFTLPFAPRPDMYVFGAVKHAAALARVGKLLGYRVTVCDPRVRFVTRERLPEADELVVAWPDEFLRSAEVDARTAVCVLTHDHEIDVPLLQVALASDAGYVGALGSSRTNAERAKRLRSAGVAEDALARLHAPIGLDIGSRTPAEVAVAIGAEIVAVARAGR